MDSPIEWKEATGGHQSNERSFQLIRNITSLADPRYHKNNSNSTKPDWIESAHIAISPTGNLILFSEQTTYLAKLRLEPANQYVTRPLNIPLDINEYVTSLLCLPIMSVQATATGVVDWTALVIGLSSGYVKFYTEQSICLLSLKFCDEPVLGFKCQTQKVNSGRSETHFPSIMDELLIIHKSLVVIADGIELYENLRLSKNEVIKSNSNYEPAYSINNLPSILNCQKWLPQQNICDADSLGTTKTTKFDSLLSESVEPENEIPKTSGRSLVFVGRNPFISFYKESKDLQPQSYTEIIGTMFSLWNKPKPSTTQIEEVTKYNRLPIFDRDRVVKTVVSSPDKRLAVLTDDFGRVLLVDCVNRMMIRIWKGYRTAQCGWIEVKRNPDKKDSPTALFLVIYAPKRGLLEVWSAQRGPRVIAFNVGKHCRLLYSGYMMLNMMADKSGHSVNQNYSSNCYLLDAKSGNVFSIEVPYSYSLYKYGDLKSRDHLLIGELSHSIQTDGEVEQISEILHRIALPKSLETAIQKIARNLFPNKIIPIMMNLVNKIMENYEMESETMTFDDESIVKLCKRLIRLSSIFNDLSQSALQDLPLPDVNNRLIEEYEEHPQEIDEFSENLSWPTTEVLRYLSLLSLERSYSAEHVSSPWPSLGEPLSWPDFISCFKLSRSKRKTCDSESCIELKSPKRLNQDKLTKTGIFLYNKSAQNFYNNSAQKPFNDATSFLHPGSRLKLVFQFWLSTKLCNHWKMWPFLQYQIGKISDELKVIATEQNDDAILFQCWKEIYNLILETDNIFAGITATAAIRSNTLRMISDQKIGEKKGESEESSEINDQHIDWECLCIDAERLSLLCRQLEDVFLLHLLLRYSILDGNLRNNYFIYRIPRLSVANILRSGPTVVSDLVSQWAVQSKMNLKIFTEPYGEEIEDNHNRQSIKISHDLSNEEQAKELLHHTITSFPLSLKTDVILSYCIWDLCRNWITYSNIESLRQAYEGITLIKNVDLRRKLCNAAYKTFIQTTLERLLTLIESNTNITKVRDSLIRKELNMDEDCIEEFVEFCCNFTELMLQEAGAAEQPVEPIEYQFDDWWSSPNTIQPIDSNGSLIQTILTSKTLDVDSLVELNRTSNVLNLIFKLKIMKSHPVSLLSQNSNSSSELRRKFARKCICNIVSKIADEMGDFSEDDERKQHNDDAKPHQAESTSKDTGGGIKSPFIVDKKRTNSGPDSSSENQNDDDDDDFTMSYNEDNNQTMILFANLLSLAKDWDMNCDELHLELVFELYRCNLDRLAAQISTRVFDKQTLASGLLKISSQRVLVLFGLSPNVSESFRWKKRSDLWSNFQPNVSSWLKSIQQEEIRREIACLSFSQFAKVDQEKPEAAAGWIRAFGVQLFVLQALSQRTRMVLESITNYLEGQAERLAYDLLELLESSVFDKFLASEAEQSG